MVLTGNPVEKKDKIFDSQSQTVYLVTKQNRNSDSF